MARIRTIKPEFFTSDDICTLSFPARLLYIGIWCEADREGRLEWRPNNLKRRYLPDDDIDIHALCAELIERRLVVPYGDGLAVIPTFAKHQHVNPREAQSSLPPPPESTRQARVDHASGTRQARVSDAQGGKEGKGKEGKEIPTTSGAAPPTSDPDRQQEQPPADPIFGTGLALLVRKGVPEKSARSFLGLFRKTVDDDLAAAELLAAAERDDVSDPLAWLRRAADGRKAQPRVSQLFPSAAPPAATPRRREFGK